MPRPKEQPGALPPPGPLGRLGRFLLGLASGAVFVLILLPRLEGPPGHSSPAPLFLAAVAGAVYMLSDITRLTFGRRSGSAPQAAVVGLGVVLAAVDLLVYGRLWAPPLAWFLFLIVEFSFGILALSLLVAAVLAVPG